MALLTVAEIQAAMPDITITPASRPSESQVQTFIDTIEGEIRGQLAACFAPWPVDTTSVAYGFIRNTLLEGTKNLVLRAKYSSTAQANLPAEVAMSRDMYLQQLRRICDVAKASRENTPETAGDFVPVVGAPQYSPTLVGSFGEYTLARNVVSVAGYRDRDLPWPL